MKNPLFFLFPSTIAASFALLAPTLHAAPIVWDAGGANNNWSTPENWNPDDADVTGDDVTFNAAGAVASGTTNTVSASASVNTLSYSFQDAANQHTTAIGAGQTLDVTGNFLLAGPVTATTPTNANITGSTGTLTVGGTLFQIGQTSPTTNTANNSLDMSGLGTLTANLGATGIFRLGSSVGTGTVGAQVTAKLAATSTITTDLLGIGDRASRGGTQTLKLGTVANTINANTISVGPGAGGGRGNGNLSFETSTGTLQLRATDGTAAVTAMNLINTSFGTANNLTATANFAGHDVNAKIVTLTMGRRTNTAAASTASATATFTFDTGTLEVGALNLAENAQALSTGGTINATMNIGGGTATIGPINMATSVAGAGATTTTAATLNFTGGTTTVNGDITKVGGGLGTTTANLNLNGATAILDMTGDDLSNLTAITYTDGLLKNLGIVNTGMALAGTGSRVFDQAVNISGIIQGAITGTGVGLTKQGVGTLALFGTNTYDGLTQIDAGGLVFGSKSAKPAATATATALGSVGLGAHDSDALFYSAAEIGSMFNSNSLAGFNLDPASGVLIDTTNAGGSFIQNIALNAARALSKTGTGTLVLPLANAFTGNVQIIGIPTSNTLRIEHAEALGPIATAKTITLTGDNRKVSILELANNITVDVDKTINTSGKSFVATGETAFGTPVFLRNASGNNAWLGNALITGAGGAYAIESAAGTLTLGAPATASVLRNNVPASTRTFNFLGGGNVVLNSQFADTDATTLTGINKFGSGTLTLPRTDNQGSLPTPVFAAGTTIVENMTDSGTPSSIGSGTGFNFGGTFRHAGAANSSSDRPFSLVGPTPTLESSGTGSLALTSGTTVNFINGAGTPIALFGLGETVVTARDAHTLFPGMTIAGAGIAAGTKITAVNYDTRQVTLDTATTAAQPTHIAATITGTTNLDRTFTLGGTNTGDNLIAATIGNPAGTGKLSLTKAGPGKWILTGGNTYGGATTVSGGRLTLGAADVLPDASPVSIGSATLDAATADLENAGTLAITGSATLRLAAGAQVEFADSNGTWSGTLNVIGFVSGSSLKFGTSAAGLSASQLSQISAAGFSGFALDANGFLIATAVTNNYASWANDPTKGNIPGEPASGDFDSDGITNLVEYALGQNPRVSSQPAGVFSGNTVTYTKGSDAIANGDVSWIIETSQTLAAGSWTAQVTQAAGNPSATIALTLTPGTPARNFARLKVTNP